MSINASSDRHEDHPHGKQSEDEINYGKIILVAVVSLVIFAVSTVWAAVIMSHETTRVQKETGASAPAALGRQEIGIVDQVPFEIDNRLELWRQERTGRLNGWGWVDKSKGIVHIPIQEAMDAVASGALPPGAKK
jgi:hypothetical protein